MIPATDFFLDNRLSRFFDRIKPITPYISARAQRAVPTHKTTRPVPEVKTIATPTPSRTSPMIENSRLKVEGRSLSSSGGSGSEMLAVLTCESGCDTASHDQAGGEKQHQRNKDVFHGKNLTNRYAVGRLFWEVNLPRFPSRNSGFPGIYSFIFLPNPKTQASKKPSRITATNNSGKPPVSKPHKASFHSVDRGLPFSLTSVAMHNPAPSTINPTPSRKIPCGPVSNKVRITVSPPAEELINPHRPVRGPATSLRFRNHPRLFSLTEVTVVSF